MKYILTSALCFVLFSAKSQLMIEGGLTGISSYDPGFSAGASFLVTKKAPSGFGFGIEYLKIPTLPVGVPIFVQGVVIGDGGFIINLRAGYRAMNRTYEDGKNNIGGLYTRIGVGYQSPKKLYVLLGMPALQVEDQFKVGLCFVAGVRF
jgi:hypothetical protein